MIKFNSTITVQVIDIDLGTVGKKGIGRGTEGLATQIELWFSVTTLVSLVSISAI